MSKRWYQHTDGGTSSMRIMAMMSTAVGCLAVLAGIIAMFMRVPESIVIAGVGAGMAGLGEVSKAWQQRNENG